jgi:phosphoserine phosphatase
MEGSVILVDICGTLYKSNTTFDFLDYYFDCHKTYHYFRLFTKTVVWKSFNLFLLKCLGIDLTRILAIRRLKGFTRNQLSEMANHFYSDYLMSRKIQPVFQLLELYKSEGRTIILVSATMDFIAVEVARRTEIELSYSTDLQYDKCDRCKGKISMDLLGRKFLFLKGKQLNPPYAVVITDNLSDIDIVKNSLHSILITTSKTEARWKRLLLANQIDKYKLICI